VLEARVRAVSKLAAVLVLLAILTVCPAAVAAAQPRLGSRTLSQGTTGSDVRTLQQELTEAGLKTPVTGEFGPATTSSVESFQAQAHLAVTGIVDARFVRALHGMLFPGGEPLGQRTLQQGTTGADVKLLQQDLTTTGYPTSVDGRFGPATKRSVVYFQRDNDLPSNGVVTYADALDLREMVAIVAVHGRFKGLGAAYWDTPPGVATITPDGTATAPFGAPLQVQEMIAAANEIIDTPYVWGGGHGSWNSDGYDCSGAVSYALHGANLLSSPEDSTSLESYGEPGPGSWVTIYADASHAFIVIAGRAFDTADYGGPNIPAGTGPRWRSNPTGNLADGGDFVVRHPAGL
jgi:peptidoglycan hydrolase-like protein with peptidoglycan-binding domain